MPKQGQTVAQANKALRQEALREQLAGQKHVEQVVKNIQKIEGLDHDSETAAIHIQKLKVANEQRLKLINKYLPDVKQVDMDLSANVVIGGSVIVPGVSPDPETWEKQFGSE